MGATKSFKSRFGDGGTAEFSDGNSSDNRETAADDTYMCDQYSSGKSSEHWGVRTVNT